MGNPAETQKGEEAKPAAELVVATLEPQVAESLP